jgi:hypothetical protein
MLSIRERQHREGCERSEREKRFCLSGKGSTGRAIPRSSLAPFNGRPSNSPSRRRYFCRSFGYKWDATKNGANPAEFVVAVAGGYEAPGLGSGELCDGFEKSDMHTSFKGNFDAMVQRDREVEAIMAPVSGTTYPTSLLAQCGTLARRQLMKTAQNKKPLIAGLLRHVVVALFYGGIYNGLTADQLLERLSLCFFSVMFVVMGNQQNIPIIFEERLLFYRERGAKIYGNLAYWVTGGVSVVPIAIFNTAVFVAIMYVCPRQPETLLPLTLLLRSLRYFMTGFRSDLENFLFFYLIVAITSLCGLFYCQLLAVVSPSQQSAITLFPATLFFFIRYVRVRLLNRAHVPMRPSKCARAHVRPSKCARAHVRPSKCAHERPSECALVRPSKCAHVPMCDPGGVGGSPPDNPPFCPLSS